MEQSIQVVEQKTVAFYEDEITAVRVRDGTIYIPIRPICDLIGVARQGQQARIGRDPILSEVSRTLTIVESSSNVTLPELSTMVKVRETSDRMGSRPIRACWPCRATPMRSQMGRMGM